MDFKAFVRCLTIVGAMIAYIVWTVYEISKSDKDDRLSFVYWVIITSIAIYITVLWAWY